ncbi:TPA: hypothetical protein ACGWER_001734 [Streptococcus agalactiae]|nr:hypothetical protein [Streptococcus agalactiae]HEO2267382.1 hypothetical protein [Streptococcus agalactiae]HEO7770444.1 hypothetical protein [Streptococcus agalactiae]
MDYKYLVVVTGTPEKAETFYDTLNSLSETEIETTMVETAKEFNNETILLLSQSLLEDEKYQELMKQYEGKLYIADIVSAENSVTIKSYTEYHFPNNLIDDEEDDETDTEAVNIDSNEPKLDSFTERFFMMPDIAGLKENVLKLSTSNIYPSFEASLKDIQENYNRLKNKYVDFENLKKKVPRLHEYAEYRKLDDGMKFYNQNARNSINKIKNDPDLTEDQKKSILEAKEKTSRVTRFSHRKQLNEAKENLLPAIFELARNESDETYDTFKLAQDIRTFEKELSRELRKPQYAEVNHTQTEDGKTIAEPLKQKTIEKVLPIKESVEQAEEEKILETQNQVNQDNEITESDDSLGNMFGLNDKTIQQADSNLEIENNKPRDLETIAKSSSMVAILAQKYNGVEPSVSEPNSEEIVPLEIDQDNIKTLSEDDNEFESVETEIQSLSGNEEDLVSTVTSEKVSQTEPIMPVMPKMPEPPLSDDNEPSVTNKKEQLPEEAGEESVTNFSNDEDEINTSGSIDKKRLLIVSGILGIILLLIILSVVRGLHNTASTTTTTKTSQVSKKTSSSSYVLTNKEYKANKEILANANIGMYIDDNGDLKGTITVKTDNGKTAVRTIRKYTKDGEMQTLDDKGGAVNYDKKWVDKLLISIKKTSTSSK